MFFDEAFEVLEGSEVFLRFLIAFGKGIPHWGCLSNKGLIKVQQRFDKKVSFNFRVELQFFGQCAFPKYDRELSCT